jgi:uncharacterized protein YbaP (TraB family)
MRWTSLILGWALALVPIAPAPAVAAPAIAAKAPPPALATVAARPALWVVRDDDTTIYLFGTIHLLKPEIRWFDGPVRKAFDKAQEVVLEVAEPDKTATQANLLRRALQPDGPALSSRLSEPRGAQYLAALNAHGVSPLLFEHVKPWFATFTLSILPLQAVGYDPQSGADHLIELAATKAGKTLIGLETSEEQIGFFESMPDDLQLAMLAQTIDELPTLTETIDRMIAAWAAGDPDGLAALMNESIDEYPEVEKRLLTDRNARWADWIRTRLEKPGTVFIAVGAGHLAGERSVQQMLAQRGIASKRAE